MKTITTFLIALLPFISTPQHGYIATEVDFRNTILQEGVKQTKGYNGTIKLGYSSGNFQTDAFVEIYPNIDYTSIGLNIYYNISPETKLRPLAGLQFSTINRGTLIDPGSNLASFGVNAALEWHLTNWLFASARWEMKYRTDLKKFEEQKGMDKAFMSYMRGSGFVGIGYKF